MSTDITPTTINGATHLQDGQQKKTSTNHEEFGEEAEMDDLRKAAAEQRVEVSPEDVGRLQSRLYSISWWRKWLILFPGQTLASQSR
jgi:hypothetical protein